MRRGRGAAGHRKRPTVVGALALDGVVAGMGVAAATGTAAFPAFVEQAPAPAPGGRPGTVAATDDLAVQEAGRAQAALKAAGLSYRHLPAHPPDPDPIEPYRSKLSGHPRAEAARSVEALDAELEPGARRHGHPRPVPPPRRPRSELTGNPR